MRRRIIIALFLYAAACLGQGRAPDIRPRFTGLARGTDAEVTAALRSAGLLVWRQGVETRIAASVLGALRARGHLLSGMPSVLLLFSQDSSACEADIRVEAGPCVVFGGISFTGAVSIPEETLARDMAIAPGLPFSEALLQSGVDRLLASYDAAAHPLASATIEDIDVRLHGEDAEAFVALRIDEGPRFIISEMSVEGNSTTNADVILRETRIGKDEPFDPVKVADIRPRLERLNLFSSVSDPALYVRNDKGGLLLRIAEGNTNVFDGVIGYQPPRAGEEAGYVTGLVNMSFRNLFGSGRRFDARWERASRSTTELELRALEPWVFGIPLNLQGGFFQRQQDSTYVRRSFDGKATVLLSSTLSVSAGVQGIRVIPALNTVLTTLPSSSTLSGSVELLIDTRDNPFNPRSGVQLRNSYAGGSKSFTRPGAIDREHDAVQRIEADVSWFRELFPRGIVAVSVHGRELRGGSLDASDLYRLGGASTLRGYREEQFSGTRLAWSNLEFRYSLGGRSFAFVFFDFGYIYSAPGEAPAREEMTVTRNGYGIGGRLETGLGVLGVSYALGQGDSFSSGKIHFGLINEF